MEMGFSASFLNASNHWLTRFKDRATTRWAQHDYTEPPKYYPCCPWCREYIEQGCGCQKLFVEHPYLHMTLKNGLVMFKGTPFCTYEEGIEVDRKYHENMQPEDALLYAHMRAEKLQQEVNVLKQELKDLTQTMSEFMNACEFVPDGPVALEILEGVVKKLKK